MRAPTGTPQGEEEVAVEEDEGDRDDEQEQVDEHEDVEEDGEEDEDTVRHEDTPTPVVDILPDLDRQFFEYELHSKDAAGAACSTGRHTYESARALCLDLSGIYSRSTSECAYSKLSDLYQRVCHPLGYRGYESRSCTFGVYPRETDFGFSGPNRDPLAQARFCVGRGPQLDIATLSYTGVALSDLFKLDVTFNWVPEAQATSTQRTSGSFQLFDAANGQALTLPAAYNGAIGSQTVSTTLDNAYAWVLSCRTERLCAAD